MAENIKKSRRTEISFLNILFCMLVIFIHIISYAVAQSTPKSITFNVAVISSRLSSFVVQGFVLLSGLKIFLTGKDSLPYAKWLKSRFFSIVIPYIICFIVYYIYYFITYGYPLDIKFILGNFFTGNLVCHLYFIPIIVQFDLFVPVWKRIINKCSPIIVIPFCIMISQLFGDYFPNMLGIILPDFAFPFNDRLFTTYLSFYIIGGYIGKNYDSFIKLLKDNCKTVLTCFAISSMLYIYYTYLSYNNICYVPFMSYVTSLYIYCVIFFALLVSINIAPFIMQKIKLFGKIDSASYNIYLWHMLFLLMTDNLIINKYRVSSLIFAFLIRAAVVYTLTVSLCIIYNKIKTKNTYL